MSTITLLLPDGTKKEVPQGSTGQEIAQQLGKKNILAIEVDGTVQDLMKPLESDKELNIKFLTFDDEGGKHAFWHSSAHVMAQAITTLFPQAKPTIGPPVDQGFYYDFDNLELSEEDFPKIEEEIKKIIKANYEFKRNVITLDKAKRLFKDNKYKQEMAEEYANDGKELTAYQDGDFIDLCEGPHIPRTGLIGAMKLMKISGAYWRGDQKNTQLTRVYGISFPDKKQLKQYLHDLQEALKRDHVRLGKKLDLFVVNEHVGQGLPLLTPRGTTLRRELYRFIQDEEIKRGYKYTNTPVLAKTELYKISGHLDHYREHMFIFKMGDDEFALRPMTCPHQYMIYTRKKHSYRDLPVRLAEIADLFRYEASGELHGLIRIRQFSLADAHIICRNDQVREEFTNVIELIQFVMKTLGLAEYWYRFSKWDPKNKDKYVDEPVLWEQTQTEMKQILDELKLEYVEAEDEAAFYGPKLDIQMRNVYGKEDTMFTVQMDFVAAKRFGLTFINDKDKEEEAMVIHRSSIGCLERTMALLIEKYAGKFPLWMNPEQLRILTVADRFNAQAQTIAQRMRDAGIRVEVDTRTQSISKKVREAQLDYVNYICVFGEKEADKDSLTVRHRSNTILGMIHVDTFMAQVLKDIKNKTLDV
ncbi:threonine--tRNA ligase [Candidatus Woesearchaeota archaeon]|nr:threonine--tRNA ligase [Candidatus Woesearchaeota archaeon]